MNTIGIIGGGIGGLCTAIALRRHGIDATVYEAAPRITPVGAGIAVPTNAMQVLHRLGLAERVKAAGMPLERMFIHDVDGTVLSSMDLRPFERRFGQTNVAIHRARLHQILMEALPAGAVVLNKALASFAQDGEGVRLSFRDGSTAEHRIVIAADGLHSAVRSALFPAARLRYSDQTSYRGVAQFELPDRLLRAGGEIWGEDARFGLTPIGNGEVYWFAVLKAPAGERDVPGTAKAKLKQFAAPFQYPVYQLVNATPEHAIRRTDLYDLRHLDCWYTGRVVLLGDAAHATTPNTGQGGAQAIEDAYVLAEAIRDYGASEKAFRVYQEMRTKKTRQVVNASWTIGKLAHVRNPIGRTLRNAVLRSVPESASRKQLEALFTLGY